MKKKWIVVALVVCAIAIVTGCSSEPEPISVESVTLSETTLTLELGATGKLTATVKPDNADDKTVTWQSSDEEVATVSNDGTVTAVKAGTATVTAKAGGKTATCAVTVNETPITPNPDPVTPNPVEHTHSYSDGKCTICGFPQPPLEGGTIIDSGVLIKYTGNDTNVVIPDSVTSIGDGAFKECADLKSVTIPNGVTIIENSVFEGCESLESVTIPESVSEIGGAFNGCISLKSASIPDGVESMGYGVFFHCEKLTEVTIPGSVTSIAGLAFSRCSGLTDVYYEGTKAQWDSIEKGEDWNSETEDFTIHCTDGDLDKWGKPIE